MKVPRDLEIKHYDRKLLLRPAELEDGPAILKAIQMSGAALSQWMDWYRPDFSLDITTEWLKTLSAAWEQGTNFQFVIMDDEIQQCVGTCGINHINQTWLIANLGYWIRTDRTGEGMATDAAKLLALFGFRHLGLRRIEIVTGVENWGSRRVAEKARATFEGILRNRLKLGEKNIDAAMYSILPEDIT